MTKLLLIFSYFLQPVQTDTTYPPVSKFEPYTERIASTPTVLKPDLSISNTVHQLPTAAVRMAYDPVGKIMYTNTFEGDVYKTGLVNGVPQNSQLFIHRNEHTINRMQGLLYHNGALYLAGNQAIDAAKNGRGWLLKCTISPTGDKTFSTVFKTDLYASSTTLFDHAFSAICLNKTADTLLIASGSRTDHGEVKDVGGMYPNLREEPLTAKIYAIPITANNLYLYNNEAWLQNSGYVFCRGVRNAYDMALNAKGEVFGIENMGDRDDPEEMNLLKRGKHYGFPWRMGGNLTPQQFSPYNPANDKLLPSNLYAPQIFHDDPTFPAAPAIAFEEPLKNTGPDANWVRNPVSGTFEQRTNITTFTSHRSPLGLNFDVDSLLHVPYNAAAFVLAYTTGGGGPSGGYLSSVDGGADVCQIKLIFNTSTQKYDLSVTRLAAGFDRLVDAMLIKNELYILEERGNIYRLTFPVLPLPVANFAATIDDNCKKRVNFINASTGNIMSYSWNFGDGNITGTQNPVHEYAVSGNKVIQLTARNPRGVNTTSLNLNLPTSLSLSGTAGPANGKISGVPEILTMQQLNSPQVQKLFAERVIQLMPGFKVNNGGVFSSEIKAGCQ